MLGVITAAGDRTAGFVMVSGVLMFMIALGINTVYSIQSVCLDIFPPQCFSGYDSLTGPLRYLVSPGLYVIAALILAIGAALWFRTIKVATSPA